MFKEKEKTPTILSHEKESGVKLKVKLNVRNRLAIAKQFFTSFTCKKSLNNYQVIFRLFLMQKISW
jgi:hypothetical protein